MQGGIQNWRRNNDGQTSNCTYWNPDWFSTGQEGLDCSNRLRKCSYGKLFKHRKSTPKSYIRKKEFAHKYMIINKSNMEDKERLKLLKTWLR